MFGDDFKKDLEPIKVSPELLEKTRKAIEEARFAQAKESLETVSADSFRKKHTLRTVIIAACSVLVVGGALLLLPRLGGNKSASKDSVMKHNGYAPEMEDAIAADISFATTAAWDNMAYETTVAEYKDEAEENTSKSNIYLGIPKSREFKTVQNVSVGDYEISIRTDKKAIEVKTADTDDSTSKSDALSQSGLVSPALSDDQNIIGLFYAPSSKTLVIQIKGGDGTISFYFYDYQNGKFELKETTT